MSFEAGRKLGNYEILSKIGEGGMGEVYRARDTDLGRDVAIKVLPAALSADADRLVRFQQEAQAASTLNHPNILVIYHIGTEGGSPYIVSELLEGETLRDKVACGPLPMRKAIDYGLQMANGLAAAHDKGIIHRDLKPENVFVTNDGRVKILDFGLAKLTQAPNEEGLTDLPTRKLQTDPGTIMGTIAYMSPEQVRAKPLDNRTDIFSFGVIFYEMLTGKMAFHGDSTADLMSSILREEPSPLSTSNANVSPALERVIDHCLEKSPEMRFNSARDLAFAIEALSGGTTTSISGFTGEAMPARRRNGSLLPWILAAVLLLTTCLFGYFWLKRSGRTADDEQQISFVVGYPEKSDAMFNPRVSPDGKEIAFLAETEGRRGLYVRPLGSTTATKLAGTDGADFQFWSPDSKQLGFFAQGKLLKIDVSGGPVQTICQARDVNGGSWGKEGVIIFGTYDHALSRVAAGGGTPAEIFPVDRENSEVDHSFPWFLPDGKHFLYLSWSGSANKARLMAGSLDGSRKELLTNNSNAQYADGYILFARDQGLMAQKFDPNRLELSGDQVLVSDAVMFQPSFSYSEFSVSDNGILAYRTAGGAGRQIHWFDRQGKDLGVLEPAGVYNDIAISPDGRSVATQRVIEDKTDIWMFDLTRNNTSRFTLLDGGGDDPAWSADGKYLYFTKNDATDNRRKLFRKSSGGAGPEEFVADSGGSIIDNGIDISRDGKFAVVERINDVTGSDLWIIPFDGSQPYQLLNSKFNEFHGKFSPDGKFLAYVSNESGRPEVFVRTFPDATGKWPVSNSGGAGPRWRTDSKELFYVDMNRQLIAVPVTTEGGFSAGAPVPLFRTQISGPTMPNRYDVSADGQKFLVNSPVEDKNPTPLTVVLNWTRSLRK